MNGKLSRIIFPLGQTLNWKYFEALRSKWVADQVSVRKKNLEDQAPQH